ncbi:MAG: hypothetical protein KF864_10425 [Phycisphaeraceae bacterium]|nr:hypothetical protein [Phycisphaeraceae bacterium]
MLLTLTASCLKSMLVPGARSKGPKLDLLDLPNFTRDTLGLSGFNLSTDLLAGANRARLETIRERTDRAGCSCLLLIEPEPQNFGAKDDRHAVGAGERMARVIDAAQILGCSAAAVRIAANDDDDTLTRVANRLKPLMERAERLDINLVISPDKGLTLRPERVTELLKKVGGFRIGTYPDFETAAASKDPVGYLHRLTPYASAVCASTVKFAFGGKTADTDAALKALPAKGLAHSPYDLKPLVSAVLSVGYDGPLALDYRGPGDVVTGIAHSKALLQTALGLDEPEDDDFDDLEDLLGIDEEELGSEE